MKPLLKEGTRILRPYEYKLLYNAVPKKDYKTMLNTLLLTGMRHVEAQRFQQHPEWFDDNFIYLPDEAEKKIVKVSKKEEEYTPEKIKQLISILGEKKTKSLIGSKPRKPRTHKGRTIILNPLGKTVVSYFVDVKTKLPDWQGWKDNLKRWAVKGGISDEKIGVKTTRKTIESWLLALYPTEYVKITLSMGHTPTTAMAHYIALGFVKDDVRDMEEYLSGWI
ncbi:MAG: hypothetical protein KAW45_02885 [Thermoplasmatales archaeon]|nr:hypothetical protein [Thermoplasmatales archaeon]